MNTEKKNIFSRKVWLVIVILSLLTTISHPVVSYPRVVMVAASEERAASETLSIPSKVELVSHGSLFENLSELGAKFWYW